jgi:hypothetical protein
MKKYSVLSLLLCSHVIYGMLINKKYIRPVKAACYRTFWSKKMNNYGLIPAAIPQTSKSILGNFRLDKEYGVRNYLAQYIAFDKQVTPQSALWADFDAIKRAYQQFLTHNSSDAIQVALNNNVIDKDYAVQALYFTHKVAIELQDFVEYHQDFVHEYANHPEQCIHKLLKDIKCEKKAIVSLVDFLQQKPMHKDYKRESISSVFRKENVPTIARHFISHGIAHDVQLFAQLGSAPATVAQTWDGLLGNFAFSKKQNGKMECVIQEYLCKYIARNLEIPEDAVMNEAIFLDIKKAFDMFVNHNHPDAILRDFENEKINKQHAKDALQFTGWVIRALEEYLANFKDDSYEMELFELFWNINRIKDRSVDMRFIQKGEWSSVNKE